jgi:hypothetical protein
MLPESLRRHPHIRDLAAVKSLVATVRLRVAAPVIRKHLLLLLLLLLLILILLLLLLSPGCQCSPCRNWILQRLMSILRPGRPEVGRHVAVGIISR